MAISPIALSEAPGLVRPMVGRGGDDDGEHDDLGEDGPDGGIHLGQPELGPGLGGGDQAAGVGVGQHVRQAFRGSALEHDAVDRTRPRWEKPSSRRRLPWSFALWEGLTDRLIHAALD
ncbi:MAG: hypothetical protein ACR2MN_15135 [Acidimicrobiales bacterium]